MNESLENIKEEYLSFISRRKSVILGSVDDSQDPNASYAPFVQDEEGSFYVLLSGLARHTPNFQNNPRASLLLIEDEQDGENIFARKRLTFRCSVEMVDRESPSWEEIYSLFQERFGSFVLNLKKMPDFRMFRFRPEEGLLVLGFGMAYQVTGPGLQTLLHRGGPSGKGEKPHLVVHNPPTRSW